MKFNLRTKILFPFIISGALLALWIHFAWMPSYFDNQRENYKNNIETHLSTLGRALTDAIIENDLAQIYSILVSVMEETPYWKSLKLANSEGETLFPLDNVIQVKNNNYHYFSQRIEYLGNTLGILELAADLEPEILSQHEELINLFLILLIAIGLFMVSTSVMMDFIIIRPLKQIANATTEIATGNFTTTMPDPSKDEMGLLILNFLLMRASLREHRRELETEKRAMDEHSIVCIADKNKKIIYVNDKFCRISGYDRNELIGMSMLYLSRRDIDEQSISNIWNKVVDGEIWHGELRNKTKSRSTYYTDTTIVPFVDDENEPYQFVQIETDITEQKQAQNEIRKANERLQHMLEYSPTIIYNSYPTVELKILDISDNILLLLGYKPDEVIADKDFWQNHIHPDDSYYVYIKLPELFFNDFLTLDYRFRHANGEFLFLQNQLKVIRDSQGEAIEVIGALTDITKRKKAEDEIKTLARFPSENPNPIFRVNIEGKLLYFNPAANEIVSSWGCGAGDALPENIGKEIEKAIKTENVISYEIKIDERIYFSVISPLLESGYLNVYLSDITARKKAEHDLEIRAKEHKAIADLGRIALEGTVLSMLYENAVNIIASSLAVEFCEVFELDSDQNMLFIKASNRINDGHISEVKLPVSRKNYAGHAILSNATINTSKKNNTKHKKAHEFLDGYDIGCSLAVIIRGREKIFGVLAIHSNKYPEFSADEVRFLESMANILSIALEREQADKALSRSNARLEHLLTVSPAMIYSAEPNNDYTRTFVSENVKNIFGYDAYEFTQSPRFWLEHIHKEDSDKLVELLSHVNGEGGHSLEYRFKHKTVGYRWIRDDVTVVCDDDGNPLELVGSWVDISERKEVEGELIAYRDHLQDLVDEQTKDLIETRDAALSAERLMSTFLANMSHELRTPLHGILSFAKFGIKKIKDVDKIRLENYFHEIKDSGEHLLSLVNNLLDLSKLKAGKMSYHFEKNDMSEVIYEVIRELSIVADSKKLNVKHTFKGNKFRSEMDKERISQVIRNLLSNAIKFSPVGGVIDIVTQQKSFGIMVNIDDQGIGIPGDELGHIFDAFSQSSKTKTSAGGTGLGLTICKEIIEAGHHGQIWAEEIKHGGARFVFWLPEKRN